MEHSSVGNETVIHLAIEKPRWRPWREITLILLMIMEISWVVPWFRSLTPATYSVGTLKAYLILLAMMLAAHLLIRLFNHLRIKIVIRQSAMVLFLLVSILIGFKSLLYSSETNILDLINRPIQSFADWGTLIPDEFILAIVVIIGWWRGISLAQVNIGPYLVMNNFYLGIFMFFVFGFINTMVTGETPGILIYVFIFTSLLAMSSSRMFVIHTLKGGGQGVFDRRWFGGISLAALIVVIVTGLSSSLLGEGYGIVGYLVMGIFYVISFLVYILFFPVLLLLVWIFDNIPIDLDFFEEISRSLNQLRSTMQQFINHLGEMINQSGIAEVISDWAPNIKAMLFWGIITLAISGFVIWVGFQLWKGRNKLNLDEDQQSLIEAKDLWNLLRSTLENRLKDLWGNLTGLSVFSGSRRIRAAERIRQIYVEMMEMCQTLNTPRPEAATPIEFMPKVVDLFPKCGEEIEVITLAYNRIRYGQLPEERSEIIIVESAWRKVAQEGNLLIESKKRIKKPPETFSGG
jgi:hypothetical protein